MNPRHPGIACNADKTLGACMPKVLVPLRPMRAAVVFALTIEESIADLVRHILMVLLSSEFFIWD